MSVDDFLKNSFSNYKKITSQEESFNYFEIDEIPDARILMTSGLSECKMKVHDRHQGEEYVELYFLLPPYWKEEDLSKSQNEWVFTCLLNIKNHIQQKNTWFGHGHTFSFTDLETPLFKSTKETHFIVSDPIALDDYLKPLSVNDKTIHFLSIIPVFKNELHYKEARGTFKMFEKFQQYRVTEKMDGYRETVIKSTLSRFFRR